MGSIIGINVIKINRGEKADWGWTGAGWGRLGLGLVGVGSGWQCPSVCALVCMFLKGIFFEAYFQRVCFCEILKGTRLRTATFGLSLSLVLFPILFSVRFLVVRS